MRDRLNSDAFERLRALDPAARPESPEDQGELRAAVRRRAIEIGERPSQPAFDRRRRRIGLRVAAALVAAVATAGLAILLLGGGSIGPGPESAFAGSAVRVAEGNPRLLIGAPGWSVSYAGEFEPDQGQIDFRDGGGPGQLSVDWGPAEYYSDPLEQPGVEPDQWYRSQAGCASTKRSPNGDIEITTGEAVECRVYTRVRAVTALDAPAAVEETRIVEPDGTSTNSFRVALPPSGSVYASISAQGISPERFGEILDSLYSADVETWLAALPAKTVRPLERPQVIDEMLAGVPVPNSVNIEEIKDESAALSRYDLGAEVTGAVACGWLDQWADATRNGDEAMAQSATEAMATARQWTILEEMAPQGGWSQVIWEYAADMRHDDRQALLGSGGTEQLPDGRVYELGPSYATGLGCDSEQRTLRSEESRRTKGSRAPARIRLPNAVPVRSPAADMKTELPPTGKDYPLVMGVSGNGG